MKFLLILLVLLAGCAKPAKEDAIGIFLWCPFWSACEAHVNEVEGGIEGDYDTLDETEESTKLDLKAEEKKKPVE